MRLFGLIGYPLSHSFSQRYFREKFRTEDIQDADYRLFELPKVNQLPDLLRQHPELRGLNVTIPHKQTVIPLLDQLSEGAEAVGAVNVIKVGKNGRLTGYNSDVYGFEKSLKRFVNRIQEERFGEEETAPGLHLPTLAMTLPIPNPALERSQLASLDTLVLGTGGASKAVRYVLKKNGVHFRTVSRTKGKGDFTYADLTPALLEKYELIVNTTPLGTAPKVEQCPTLPYEVLTSRHHLFDLVYNPETTEFLRRGAARGAATQNGMEMLHLQADRAWDIWEA